MFASKNHIVSVIEVRSSPPNVFFSKVFTFFEEHIWETASGKMGKWQESNGKHFQMFQKQSPSGVLLKRCLSFLKKTSGGMLLEFLKNRYIVRRGLFFYYQVKKIVFCFVEMYKNSLLLHGNLVFFLFAMSEMPCIGC